MTTDVCFLLCCGIPASGKSSFIKRLKSAQHEHDMHIVHVCYDELLPCTIEKEIIEDSMNQSYSKWKAYRQKILEALDAAVSSSLPDSSSPLNLDSLDSDFVERFKNHVISSWGHPAKKVIAIDDNLFYQSMRHQFYQLARKHHVGFAQLHFPCDVTTSLHRNAQREHQVADDVIVSMATKFEKPDPENFWEKHFLQWRDSCELSDVFCLLEAAFCDPVVGLPEDDPRVKEQSQLKCSQSAMHQIDRILRALVSESMTQVREKPLEKAAKQLYAKEVNMVKRSLFEAFRDGELCVAAVTLEDVTNACKEPQHPLYVHVRDLYSLRIQSAFDTLKENENSTNSEGRFES